MACNSFGISRELHVWMAATKYVTLLYSYHQFKYQVYALPRRFLKAFKGISAWNMKSIGQFNLNWAFLLFENWLFLLHKRENYRHSRYIISIGDRRGLQQFQNEIPLFLTIDSLLLNDFMGICYSFCIRGRIDNTSCKPTLITAIPQKIPRNSEKRKWL